MKKNKGITLIALIITIIVMLILVAVTINMAVNGGLFRYAGSAASQTKKAIAQESGTGGFIAEDGTWYSSMEDYMQEMTQRKNGLYIGNQKIGNVKVYDWNSKPFSYLKFSNNVYSNYEVPLEEFLTKCYNNENVDLNEGLNYAKRLRSKYRIN